MKKFCDFVLFECAMIIKPKFYKILTNIIYILMQAAKMSVYHNFYQ